MAKFKNKYRIESNRNRYWDYSSPGHYFLTVCIENRECILGRITDQKMNLSAAGEIVQSEILQIPSYHPRIVLGEWVIMPNHIHLIVELTGHAYSLTKIHDGNTENPAEKIHDGNPENPVEKIHEFSLQGSSPESSDTPPPRHWWNNPNHIPDENDIKQYRRHRRKMLIPIIMGKMKMKTSKQINILNDTPGKKNWQSDYHDRIIRDRREYINIKNYIKNNPRNWEDDMFHR